MLTNLKVWIKPPLSGKLLFTKYITVNNVSFRNKPCKVLVAQNTKGLCLTHSKLNMGWLIPGQLFFKW